MRRFTKAVVTVAAIAGAMTATGAAAAAAPAAPSGEVTTQATNWYYGYGYGSSQFSAIQDAKWRAENQAWMGGYNPLMDCYVTRQYAYKIAENYYRGEVTLVCYR